MPWRMTIQPEWQESSSCEGGLGLIHLLNFLFYVCEGDRDEWMLDDAVLISDTPIAVTYRCVGQTNIRRIAQPEPDIGIRHCDPAAPRMSAYSHKQTFSCSICIPGL